jgi:hypothetical protein
MTSPTYHADDDQLVQEHDQVVPENNLTEPDADLAVAEPDLVEPDADLAVAEPDLVEPDADQAGQEYPASHPVGAAVGGPESEASIVSGYPGFTPDGENGAQDPKMADSSPGAPRWSRRFTRCPSQLVNISLWRGHCARRRPLE